MSWNLPSLFQFTELEKLQVFFSKPDLIRKLHLLKLYALLSTMVTIMVAMGIVGKGYGNIQWPKDVGNHHH